MSLHMPFGWLWALLAVGLFCTGVIWCNQMLVLDWLGLGQVVHREC